jgi:uroporphyrinogen-III decarboxylase
MLPRERVLATLRRQPVDRIPSYEEFYDLAAERKFAPQYAGMKSYGTMPALRQGTFEEQVGLLRLMDCDFAEVGMGRLRARAIADDASETVYEFENGAAWRLDKRSGQNQPVSLPLQVKADPRSVPMPDPDDPRRYEGVAEAAALFKARGYFTLAKVHGFFTGAWYLFRPLDDLFIDMVDEPELVHAVVDRIGEYNFRSARNLLERGVDCILFGDDMGSSAGLLFSRRNYVTFFQAWHRRMAELCHAHGGYLQIHSHGNINGIMPELAATGLDILNPVGPEDDMDLEQLLMRYGERLAFAGGVSKRIGEMGREELAAHLETVIGIGKRLGSYIFRSEGGIPPTMGNDTFAFYLETARRLREV